MTRLTIAKAQDQLAETLARISRTGERIALTERGKQVAFLVSAEDMARLAKVEKRADRRQVYRAKLRPRPSELMKRPPRERERILAASVVRAAQAYRDNPELTDFEAFADEDLAE
ncbi:MAG: type II toxin-antitoxin system prevent-host-death family antitoxin [Candidatus Sumerlaeota bacterium]|nr:type II toxin-antitoxin system prevent-host-death family antitoxin [Candidatus Sumerlaeota bacterium]